jgi:hypothetical protein
MEKIIAQRLVDDHSNRKLALGEFLNKKANMLRDQRIQDSLLAEKLEE